MSVPDFAAVGEVGGRSAKLWPVLRSGGHLVSLSPAPMPPVVGFLYRLMAWARFPSSCRFGQVNLRAEVFDLRSRTAAAMISKSMAEGGADVIFQEGFFFTPAAAGLPYAVYVDGTAAMVERHYPAQVPWLGSAAAKNRWMLRERALYDGALRVFTYSDFCKRSVCADYGVPAERVSVMYPGLNFQPKSVRSPRHEGSRRVIFVGYDFKRKGGEVLLEAWRLVRRRLPSAELIIIGPPANSIKPVEGVVAIGPVASPAQMSEYFASADLFCMPSLFEAYGHVFLEAMSHGLPCVGASSCAMPEIIRPGVNGLLASPGDAGNLAECLIEVLSDLNYRARLSDGAVATAAGWNTWGQVSARMVNILQSDLARFRQSCK